MEHRPVLYIVVPCYNEEAVLPLTAGMFTAKLEALAANGRIDGESRVLFVSDGSTDGTWDFIRALSAQDARVQGICLSRNRGHQNALLAGLFEAMERCDITISIDCDGQDDIDAMDRMVDEYLAGADIVYGVRDSRATDTPFKRGTARAFYKLLRGLGAVVVYDHADYRLLSARVLRELSNFREVNIYLRGMIPLVGFKSTCVSYTRRERLGGKSHYPLRKMLALGLDGITSLSIRPIRMIIGLGLLVALISLGGIVWSLVSHFLGVTVAGWTSMTCIICFLSGVQLLCFGVIGEYIGKIYLETKARPRYIVSERTEERTDHTAAQQSVSFETTN